MSYLDFGFDTFLRIKSQNTLGVIDNVYVPALSSDVVVDTSSVSVESVTSVYLNNDGLKIKDTDATHGLTLQPGSNLTADRILTIITGDANRTLTLNGDAILPGGTYGTMALQNANNVSITGGSITGITDITLADGGTNASLVASNGGIVYSTASAMAILSGTATAGQILLSGLSTTPSWSTATYPAITTINQLLYSSAANTITGLATSNNGVLVTGGTGIPAISTDIPTAATIGSAYIYRAGGTDVAVADGGTGGSVASITLFNNITGYTASGATGTTSTNLVFSTSPILVTPTLGVASATSINKVAITAPVTAATLTIADGATLTVSASATISSGTHSGTNTGDQTITLTGDVTGTGAGSFATTIGANKVTYGMIQVVSTTDKILGRSSAGSGNVEEIVCTATGRNLIDDTSTTAQIATLGLDADIATFALPANTTISAYGATLVDDVDASTARATLGLGSISTQASNSVSITGGTITGITDLTVADGGSGASTLTGILKGNGTSAFTAIAIPANASNFLDGTGAFDTVKVYDLSTTDVAWSSYNVTWTNLTEGNGTEIAYYKQIGSIVFFRIQFTLGSTSSVTGAISFSLPLTAIIPNPSTLLRIGFGSCDDVSGFTYNCDVTLASTSTALISVQSTASANVRLASISSTVPMTWTTGDSINISGFYEVAVV